MSITVSQLTGGQSATDATSYATASISPSANKLVLVTVFSEAGTASAPTVTGASMTWTQIDTQAQSGRRVTVFRSLNASPGSGALTIDFGANTQDNIMWTVEEFTGMDITGTNGSGAIVQVTKNTVSGGTALTVTLAAFSNVNNATYGAFGIGVSTTSTAGSGFSKVGDQGVGNNRMTTEFKDTNDTSVDITWADIATDDSGGIAIEIKAGASLVSSERDSEINGTLLASIPATYRIVVRDGDDQIIGEFTKFRNLNFGKRLNNYGIASFEIPVIDPDAENLVSLREYTVWIYYQKDAVSTLVWSGEQAMREGRLDNAGNNWCTIHCYDWFEQLNARYTASEVSFDQVDAGQIAWELIDQTQRPVFDTIFRPTANGPLIELNRVGAASNYLAVNEEVADGDTTYVTIADDANYVDLYEIDTSDIQDGAEINSVTVFAMIATDVVSGGDNSVVVKIGAGSNYFSPDLGLADDSLYTLVSYTWNNNPATSNPWTLANINDLKIGLNLSFAKCSQMYCLINYDYISIPGNDFGITEGTIEATIDRDRTYYNQNIMEAIINLTNVLSGFDFEITNNRVFNVYSVKGEDKSEDIILEYGVNIESVQVVEDFTSPVNRAIILGQSTDDINNLVRIERNDTGLQETYKIREGVLSEMDVTDTLTMEDKGDALIRKYGNPLLKIDIDLVKSTNVTVVDFALGDLITLVIQSGVYNIDETYRIFEYNLVFDDNNAEKLSLILGNFTI